MGGYAAALDQACVATAAFGPDVLVVSLGVDTFELDPISRFRLVSDDYRRLGARIEALGRPTLLVFEGGYAVEAVGVNTINVLQGFEGG
jgi:acetoin utilization deacetylase AcuC-like enzyme